MFGKGTCTLSDTEGNAKVFAFVSMGADTERQTLGRRFEGHAAYLTDCSVVLPLRPSARAAPPSGPSLLDAILRAWEQRRELRHVDGVETQ